MTTTIARHPHSTFAASSPTATPTSAIDARHDPVTTEARPIFVVGALRSGTSLLALSLGQHPNILPVPDTGWLERFVTDLHRTYHEAVWQPETSILHAADMEVEDFCAYFGNAVNRLVLEAGTVEPEPVVDALAGHGNGKEKPGDLRPAYRPQRWIDGTGNHCFDVFPLMRLFPLAKFIHVVRDVREVVASLVDEENRALYKSRHLLMTERDAYEHWLDATTAAFEAERAFGSEAVLRVRRRDLFAAPEEALRRCLAFVGEPYDAACLRPFRPAIAGDEPSPNVEAS